MPEQPVRLTALRAVVDVELAADPMLDGGWDAVRIESLVQSIVEREVGPGHYSMALYLVGDDEIRALNREHRGQDAHTDVLSFPLHDPTGMRFVTPPDEPIALGDVVVSWPRALEQAREFGHTPAREIAYLVAHGVLHVLGYDHEREADQRVMRAREEESLAAFGLTRD
ncbi:MAG: rRNA maturation RNase YbeY [Chloroflexi bacterium]|nr:rRNA maturation RNase YbeY [Chloroflexota bacterium]